MDSRATRPSVDPRTSLALWLRAGRTQSRLSLDEVARVTKIQPRILEQLETGQLDGLPAEVFVRGFVKSFARCVGLNEGEALKRWVACAGVTSPSSATARAFIETLVAAPVRTRMATGTVPPPFASPVVADGPGVQAKAAADPHVDRSVALEHSATSEIRGTGNRSAEPLGRTKKHRGRRRKQLRSKKLSATPASQVVTAGGATAADSQMGATAEANRLTETAGLAATSAAGSPASAPREAIVSSESATHGAAPSVDLPVRTVAPESAMESGRAERAPAVVQSATEARTARRAAHAESPKVPWRRPTSVIAGPAKPSLVIDDADPELADMQRDERDAAKKSGPQRVSFLPPILLDRDERGGRQGGLTLAVILLLIAATLTLSYLMRRPSVSGDGVTSNASDGRTVAALVR